MEVWRRQDFSVPEIQANQLMNDEEMLEADNQVPQLNLNIAPDQEQHENEQLNVNHVHMGMVLLGDSIIDPVFSAHYELQQFSKKSNPVGTRL